MSDLLSAPEQPEGSLDAAVDSVLDKIGTDIVDGEAPADTTTTTESAPASGEDAGSDAGEAQDQSEVGKEAQPLAPEPPPGLTHDEIEVFKSLPPAAQEMIQRRERERRSEFSRGQDEIATKTKAIDGERQRLAQAADQFVQLAGTLDPILAEGQRIDWEKFSREDPAGCQTKLIAYNQRVAYVQQALAIRQQESQNRAASEKRANDDRVAETRIKEARQLLAKAPEWSDPKRYQADWTAIVNDARHYGFKAEEVEGLTDHRQILAIRDAIAYRKLQAAQKSAQAKQVVPVPKVQKPGSGESTAQDRAKAMMQRVRSAGSLEEKADRIAALIEG